MDLNKLTNDKLNVLCKDNKIKGYSKLKKAEKIEKLREIGVTNFDEESVEKSVKNSLNELPSKKTKVVKKEKKELVEVKEKKETKPRNEKLDKKIIKLFDEDRYKNNLLELKEEPSRAYVLNMLSNDITKFIDKSSDKEIREVVDKFGVSSLISYQKAKKDQRLFDKSEQEIYKILALYLVMNDPLASDPLIKVVIKAYHRIIKSSAEDFKIKKVPKKEVKRIDPPKEDESEEDDVLDNDDDIYEYEEDLEEPDYNDSDEENDDI